MKAQEIHPRLFITPKRINQLKSAIQVPSSHHQQAFYALKNRVDQNDWRIYGYDEGNWNYARSHLAKESALLYLLTNEPKYAQISYQNIEAIYEQPDPDNRLPDRNYGLSRAMVGSNIAMAYDWAYHGMTEVQRGYVKNKINIALSAWLDFEPP